MNGQVAFASAVLHGIGAPVTKANVAGFIGWSKAEGGSNWQRNNPLNTTESLGSSGSINSAGVRIYPNAQAGVRATVRTLLSGPYGGILHAFRTGNVHALPGAIGSSPWGTSGSLAAQTIAQTLHGGISLGGGGSLAGSGSAQMPSLGSPPGLRSVTSTQFNSQGFQQARDRYIAGEFLSKEASQNPWGSMGGSSAYNALFQSGALTTRPPNPANFTSTKTRVFSTAQDTLQQIAGPTKLAPHLQAAKNGGGFLPRGAQYVPGRHDQGQDGQTNPGGAILAPGNGYVVRVGSDPGGFGPAYPIVHFTSGPYAGRTIYLGHTLATVRPGQRFTAGTVLSHTGTHGVGNATVPGWFEIGYADHGTPGPFGQPVPF